MDCKINWIKSIFLLVMVVCVVSCSVPKITDQKATIVFYNVENLFDLEDEPEKHDGEFTPDGSKKWTQERYNKKLGDIAKVLSSVDTVDAPEIIGLCEVENKKVLEDLIATDLLADSKYQIIHYESPDFRGIDVALLYRADEFEVKKSEAIPVTFLNDSDYVTRDVLYVEGELQNEKIHLFICHWPSRIGGMEKTEPKRMLVASIIKKKVDTILEKNSDANIVIMGDMNDEPENKSILEILSANSPELAVEDGLVNMMFPAYKNGEGSYSYRSDWNMLDNIIVSSTLLDGENFDCDGNGKIFRKEFMEYTSQSGKVSPNRTYGGSNYYGGISDHFPVFVKLKK